MRDRLGSSSGEASACSTHCPIPLAAPVPHDQLDSLVNALICLTEVDRGQFLHDTKLGAETRTAFFGDTLVSVIKAGEDE